MKLNSKILSVLFIFSCITGSIKPTTPTMPTTVPLETKVLLGAGAAICGAYYIAYLCCNACDMKDLLQGKKKIAGGPRTAGTVDPLDLVLSTLVSASGVCLSAVLLTGIYKS